MNGWRALAGPAIGAMLSLVLCVAAAAAPCDEADPAGPMRSVRVTLNARDFVSEEHDELRSFVATGSLGRVDAAIVSSHPGALIRTFAAGPEISRFSPNYGEALKGVAIIVTLRHPARAVSLVINLRQVCAHYFRNSFLYY